MSDQTELGSDEVAKEKHPSRFLRSGMKHQIRGGREFGTIRNR